MTPAYFDAARQAVADSEQLADLTQVEMRLSKPK
jgi:hypothetical protein